MKLTRLLLLLCLGAVPALAQDWPREVRSGDVTVVLYQPQFDSLDGIDARARMAVSIQRPEVPPEFGALWVAATLAVDRDTARFRTFDIERARFPDASAEEVQELTALLERTAPAWDLQLSLAELRAGLEAAGGGTDPGFRNDPPRILYRDRPAILVTLDGEPRLQPIRATPWQRVINTAFPIVFDPATGQYWLYGSAAWFTTRDLAGGPWSARDDVPRGIAGLFAAPSATAAPVATPAGTGVPADQLRRAEIVVATTPTELIATDGPPAYRPLVGDDLLYVANTGSDLFLEVPTKQHYVVLSGRWYRAASLAGPWTFVPPADVPGAFTRVPATSDKADVLAHVPGSDAAKDAVMDTMIPQTVSVRRSDAALAVTWDGTPRFDGIPGTALAYGSNTAAQVLQAGDLYYAVDQGIWYVADGPEGPWAIADARPGGVEQIPPTSPAYNLRYVYIYEVTPDTVQVGYLPGYAWAFPYQGAVVYGTGYDYRPWLSPYHYYPRPRTWGFHSRYRPWYGWGYGASWLPGWNSFYSGWGGYWWRAGYGPGYRHGYQDGYYSGFWAGQYSGGWWGPGGYRPPPPPPRRDIQPPRRTQIATLPGIGGRPSASRSGNRRTAQPVPRPNPRRPNNVYVDREGIPHRRTTDGWETRENRRWRPSSPVVSPKPPPPRVAPPPSGTVVRPLPPPSARRPSPPVSLRPRAPAPPAAPDSRPVRPERDARPPPAGGWGNRAVPRDGPSLPASREARLRSHDTAGAAVR